MLLLFTFMRMHGLLLKTNIQKRSKNKNLFVPKKSAPYDCAKESAPLAPFVEEDFLSPISFQMVPHDVLKSDTDITQFQFELADQFLSSLNLERSIVLHS